MADRKENISYTTLTHKKQYLNLLNNAYGTDFLHSRKG